MNLYIIGKVVGCFGIKGWVKIQPMTDGPERLKELSSVYLGFSESDSVLIDIEEVKINLKSVTIKFNGIDDRTASEALSGKFLFVDNSHLKQLPDSRHFIHDIIGCEVETTDGKSLGIISEVYKMPSQDIWEIKKDNKIQMIPAVKEFIRKVDTKNKKIIVQIIEGLLEE